MYSNKIIKLQSFFIYILPICLVTGPFLPDLIVTLSSIFFLIISIKRRFFLYYKNIFFKIFIIFWLYITLNSIFAINPFLSLKSSLFFIRFGIFSILVYYLIDSNKDFLNKFSLALFIIFSIVLLDSYLQYFTGSNIFGMISPQSNRLSSFFGKELIVGSFLSRLFPLILAFGILMHDRGIKYLGLICIIFLILTDVIIFLSGERTSFGLLVIVNILYIIYVTKYKMLRIFAFTTSIIVIAFFVLNDEKVKERMITQTTQDVLSNELYIKKTELGESTLMNLEKEFFEKNNRSSKSLKELEDLYLETQKTASSKARIKAFSVVHESHFKTALNMFFDKPIFGVGPNMFRHECSKDKYASGDFNCTTHPHNIHIQVLAETGIIGYLIFLIPFLLIIKIFFKNLFKLKEKKSTGDDYKMCLLIAFFITLFPLAPGGNFFNNWLSIVHFLPVGFFLHVQLKKNEY